MTRYFSAIYNLIPIHGKKEYEAGNIKVMDRIIIQKQKDKEKMSFERIDKSQIMGISHEQASIKLMLRYVKQRTRTELE